MQLVTVALISSGILPARIALRISPIATTGEPMASFLSMTSLMPLLSREFRAGSPKFRSMPTPTSKKY